MRVAPASNPKAPRILDFDTESLAAGFADPAWVPQKITCCAWSWVGEDKIHVRSCGYKGFFVPEVRARMLKPFIDVLRQADIVCGHNLLRHDLGVINAESMRLGLGVLPTLIVQDTIKLPKTKGFKKGQDNLARLVGIEEEKLSLDWQGWDDAYAEPGWPTVRERCVSDVAQNKALRVELLKRRWVRGTYEWKP